MTERDKMLAGKPYNAGDKELLERWNRGKLLMQEFNSTPFTERERLDNILSELLGSKGENVIILGPFFVDYGENIYIGNNCEINMNCVFLDCNCITIGDNTGIGPSVQIYAVSHPIDPQERLSKNRDGTLSTWKISSLPVTIGSNVWIGGGTIILQGVTIGDNTTIAAGSVVTKSIPANCLAEGNPCQVIRHL